MMIVVNFAKSKIHEILNHRWRKVSSPRISTHPPLCGYIIQVDASPKPGYLCILFLRGEGGNFWNMFVLDDVV